MKKILAVLLAIASVLSLSACQSDDNNSGITEPVNAEEFQSNIEAIEAEQSNAIAESMQEAADVQNETYDKYVKKVGKTQKNKQIVVEVKRSEDVGREFWKFEFKKNGEFDTKIVYYFLPTTEQYNAKVEIAKDVKGLKLVEKDKEAKLVVVRNDKFNGKSYDKMYENYTDEAVAEKGYIIVE